MNAKGILLTTFLISSFINLNAQLKVKSDGLVRVGNATPSPMSNTFEVTGQNKTVSAAIFSMTANNSNLWCANNLFAFAFGIDQYGVGQIYRNFNSPSSIMSFNSYGEFGLGKSPSSGWRLDVNGSIRCSGTVTWSDSSYKSNINSIATASNLFYKLNGVSYSLKNSNGSLDEIQTETLNKNKPFGTPAQADQRLHYGFIAQDVKKLFPELVYEDNSGLLGIDYIGFIPMIVEELKTHKLLIDSLRKEINLLRQSANMEPVANSGEELFQNFPNPFNENTTIKFKLSENTKAANLFLYDLQGNQIKSFIINDRGESSIIIKGSELRAGLYLYSLVADGKLIGTKQMVLTK